MADGESKTGTEGTDGTQTQAVPSITLADLKTAGLPETYFGEDGSLKAQDLTAHLTEYGKLKQRADARAAGIPADGKYAFDLPKDFKAPEGYEWNPDPAFTAEVAKLAKEEGLTQAQLSKLTVAYAQQDLAKRQAAANALKAENTAIESDAKKVLGENFKEVVATTRQAGQALFVGLIGKEDGELLAKDIAFNSAAGVKAYNKLINALNSGSHATNHRAGDTDTKSGENAELAARIGKEPMGLELLKRANATGK